MAVPEKNPEKDRLPLLGSQGCDREFLELQRAQIPFPACRHILAVMAFLGFFNLYALRSDLSVTLVSMVSSTVSKADNTTILDTECLPEQPANGSDRRTEHPAAGEFYWSKNQQGILLGAFFYGYVASQIVGGRLAENFGGKHVFGIGILGTSILTLLTPVASRAGYSLLVGLRVVEGLFSGLVFPATHAILSQWVPPYERTKLGTFILTGANLGTMITMPVSGILSHRLGWPSVFYVFGLSGCLWWVLWMFLMYSSPRQHPRISAAEKYYIETAINSEGRTVKMSTPWIGILTSMAFWAILVAHTTHNWGYYMLMTCLPQYMNDILHYDIAHNGILSGLPYLASWIVGNIAGQVVDFLRLKRLVKTRDTRKAITIIGFLGSAVFLLAAGYVGCNKGLAVAMFSMAMGFGGVLNASALVNHLDIAPRFAGTLLGLTNTVAGLPGIFAPLAVTSLTAKENTRHQWILIFYISGAIYVFGSVFYGLFASGVEQEWAKADDEFKSRLADSASYGSKKSKKGVDNVVFVTGSDPET